MPIKEFYGNIFDASTEAIVNPVNCVGVMGAGLALQFKTRFPKNYKAYEYACARGNVKIGEMFCHTEHQQLVINFPTKNHWKHPSQIDYIGSGLQALRKAMYKHNIDSIAIPAIGCGLGGLDRVQIKRMIEAAFDGHTHFDIRLYGF